MANESLSVFEAQVRGEIDMQVATAKAYPRNVQKFLDASRKLALSSAETAGSCMYALPRRDKDGRKKTIEGPSVRFAEIISSQYGNCRIATRVLDADGRFVTAQAVFIDLEANVARSIEIKRRITTAEGVRYSDDMVMTTANAASSIAAREAVVKGIPEAVWGPIYDEARALAVGKDTGTFAAKRDKLMAQLAKMGATEDRVLKTRDAKSTSDLDAEDCMELEALKQAIRDGGTTVDAAFPPIEPGEPQETKAGLAGLQQKLAGDA